MAKVLLIEDEKAMSDLIAIKFRVEGFDVEQAFTLAEAKQKVAQAGPFDAILTDYLLPDGELVDFLEEFRRDPKGATIPVIVMTNYIEDLNMEKLKSLGIAEAIVKYQVVPAQMVEKIKALVGNVPAAAAAAAPPQPIPTQPVPQTPPVPTEVPAQAQIEPALTPAPVPSEPAPLPQPPVQPEEQNGQL